MTRTTRCSTVGRNHFRGRKANFSITALKKILDLWGNKRVTLRKLRGLVTHMRAITLSSKTTLSSSDIVDRGIDRPKDTARFHLLPGLYLDLHKTSGELQFYLERMASLIPERESHFIVDPKDTFLTILNGAYDIAQLHAAWMGITKRIGLGVKYIR